MKEERGGIPPINRQTLWVKRLPDTVIETQVIYVLLEAHTDIDILQTLYSMWTYDGTWHLMTGENVIAISITQLQYETLVTNNLLVTGQQYLISDLTFTYNIGGTAIPATYNEPLLVTALSNNELLPIAYPINHPNDYVEVDWSKPEITFRHDLLLNNHIGYDYRNKLNRRYKFNVSNVFNPTTIINDWYVPARDELGYIYTNLFLQGIGDLTLRNYWSSTEVDATTQYIYNFTTGEPEIVTKDSLAYLRLVRKFDSTDVIAIGTQTESGGWIYYMEETVPGTFTYYESGILFVEQGGLIEFTEYDTILVNATDVLDGESNTNLFSLSAQAQQGFFPGLNWDSCYYAENYSNTVYLHAQGDVVINGNDDIYIAVKDNSSTVLTDGNWFKFPFKNGTYSATSKNTPVYISGMTCLISADENDYNDYLTFLGNILNVTTGSNFNNVVSQFILGNCVFGSGNYNLTFDGNCIGITIGNENHDFHIFESQNTTIKNANSFFYIDGLFYSNIENHISGLGLSNGINVSIKDSCSVIISTKPISSSIFDTLTNNFVSTVNIVDLYIKPNISLVNLTDEVLALLPLGFHKTIENMFSNSEGVKPMLYYMDADSSLPILVEIQ